MERLRADIALGRESVYRDTRCTLSDAVVWERTWDAVQETIERVIPVQQYYYSSTTQMRWRRL